MWLDVLTKEMRPPDGLEEILVKKNMDLSDTEVTKVKSVDGEVQRENIRNNGGWFSRIQTSGLCFLSNNLHNYMFLYVRLCVCLQVGYYLKMELNDVFDDSSKKSNLI